MNMVNEMNVGQARDEFDMGRPVCLTERDGKLGRAQAWSFATLRRDENGTIQLRGPGRTWYEFDALSPRETFGATELNSVQMRTWRLGRVLLRILCHDTDVTPKSAALLRCVACANPLCGETLTHPDSIVAHMGPTCRGEVARREAKRDAKRAVTDTFMERMRERMGR